MGSELVPAVPAKIYHEVDGKVTSRMGIMSSMAVATAWQADTGIRPQVDTVGRSKVTSLDDQARPRKRTSTAPSTGSIRYSGMGQVRFQTSSGNQHVNGRR